MAVDDSYTKTLLHFNGSNHGTGFTDESGRTWTNDVNYPCWLDTSNPKFGESSLVPQVPDNGGDISTPVTADLLAGSGNFTLDLWIYCDSTGYGHADGTYWLIKTDGTHWVRMEYSWMSGSNYAFRFRIYNGSLVTDINSTPAAKIEDNAWHHLAFVRNGTALKIYWDGSQVATGTVGNWPDLTGGTVYVGDDNGSFYGNADEIRFSNGIARWTSAFSVPTSEYTSGPGPVSLTADPLDVVTSLEAVQAINVPVAITADPFNAITSLTASQAVVAIGANIVAVPFEAVSSLVASGARGQNRLVQNLPLLVVSGTLTTRSGMLRQNLPFFTIDAGGESGETGRLSARLPFFAMSGTGLTGGLGILEKSIPFFTLSATGQPQRSAVANLVLPFFYINAHGEAKPATAIFKVLAMNLKHFAVTEYENFDFNSFAQLNGVLLGAKEDGIYPLVGTSDQGVDIDAVLTTGKTNIEHWRLRDFFSYGLSGGQKRSKLARGLHSGYTDFTIQNENGEPLDLDYFEVFGDPVRRKKH